MPKKKYIVDLSDAERAPLSQLVRRATHASRKVTRARLLLLGWRVRFSAKVVLSNSQPFICRSA